MTPKWSNWAGNETARPASFTEPRDEAEVVEVVRRAAESGSTAKVVGSGHSFTPTAVSDGDMMSIKHLSGIRAIDRESMTVTVGAGTTLNDLNRLLAAQGLAMANLGDIAYQSVAGAVSTSTHGTGVALPGLAAQIVGLRLVDGNGRLVDASPTQNTDVLDVARVSVGSLGVITEATIKIVDAFRLRALEQPMKLDSVLENIYDLKSKNDHFEFFWIPHTKWALTKQNNRTDDTLDPLPRVRGWFDKTFMENYAFGALCRVGRMKPSLIPRLATALPSSGSRTYVDDSYKIFASRRLVRFYEMEYSIPAEHVVDALSQIRSMVERKGYLLNFPVEVRFTAPDDVPLSTSYGRESAYIAVHVYKGMPFEPYFRDVEDIVSQFDARPHWGKIHYRTREDLKTLYPRFGDFLAMRDRLDPLRVFENRYTRKVFG
jgi:L-gulono-1,4-lactone dehydrogenase